MGTAGTDGHCSHGGKGFGAALRHDGRNGQPRLPARVVSPAVGVRLSLHRGRSGGETAQQVEAGSGAAVLHRPHGLQPGLSGKVGQAFPAFAAGPLETVGGLRGPAVGLAAGHIEVAASVAAGHVVKALGQRGQRGVDHVVGMGTGQQPHVGIAAPAVCAADAHKPLGHGDAHAIGQLSRQVAHAVPRLSGRCLGVKFIDVGIVHLGASVGSGGSGKIASSGHPHPSVDASGKRSGNALRRVYLQGRQRAEGHTIEGVVVGRCRLCPQQEGTAQHQEEQALFHAIRI